MSQLIAPHGGQLVNLIPTQAAERVALKREATQLPAWDLSPRQLCDLEMLLSGAFSPLDGFMTRADYEGVCKDMRLTSGVLWPVPITLDVTKEFAAKLGEGKQVALRDPEGVILAVLDIAEAWEPDREVEARHVFGTTDSLHAGVNYLLSKANPVYLGGKLRGPEPPRHYDFRHLRLSPRETRMQFEKLGWQRIVAFQTRNPMHRAHLELTFRAAQIAEGKPADPPERRHDEARRHRPLHARALLREADQPLSRADHHAEPASAGDAHGRAARGVVARDYPQEPHGCTHFIVGRDHAGPGSGANGKPFYGPYDAQELVREHQEELGITMVPFQEMVFVQERAQYVPSDEIQPGETVLNISGTELRRRLHEGLDIPDWFTYPEVIEELRRTHPPRHKQGFTVFFTGLSGSGKSTLANALLVRLLELGTRPVTLLDGDVVRKHLSSELGFSKEHRNLNVQRIGFVGSEITKNGGVAICAPIARRTTTHAARCAT